MSLIVQKYGGSSVADAAKITNVARRIIKTKDAGNRVVVVVSAMGDTTDDLIKLAYQINQQPDKSNWILFETQKETSFGWFPFFMATENFNLAFTVRLVAKNGQDKVRRRLDMR